MFGLVHFLAVRDTERECFSLPQEASGTCCHRQVERKVHIGEENVFVVHILDFLWDLQWCFHDSPTSTVHHSGTGFGMWIITETEFKLGWH